MNDQLQPLVTQEDLPLPTNGSVTNGASSPYLKSQQQHEAATEALWSSSNRPGSTGTVIEARSVGYSVSTPKKKLTILDDVTFKLDPCGMCALMGASGAGKTTLLDVVAGRKTGGNIAGLLHFNGHIRNKFFARLSAYVMQDDVHIGSLSVEETLTFAARLRMPNATQMQHGERVELMLEWLGLKDVRDSIIGDELVRGISGGQRKRLSIGVEVIALPEVIFLDEPTSGLDSEMAFEVMAAVSSIARQHRTVMVTIHQPSPEVFNLFGTVMLLSDGKMAFFGPKQSAREYFTASPLNYRYVSGQNVADYLLHLCGRQVPEGASRPRSGQELNAVYMASGDYARLQEQLRSSGEEECDEVVFADLFPTRLSQQTYTLIERGFVTLRRDVRGRYTVMLRSVVISLFLGSLFYQQDKCGQPVVAIADEYVPPGLGNFTGRTFSSKCYYEITTDKKRVGVLNLNSEGCSDCQEGVYNRFSLLFFSALFLMMGNLQGIYQLCKERSLFYREREAGLYYTWAHFTASTIVYFPVIFCSTMIYAFTAYYLVGFDNTAEAFLYFSLTMLLVNLIGYSFAQLLAAASPTADIALSVFPMSFIFFNTFAGFLIHVPKVPSYWKWACDISFVRWAIQGLVINELENQPQLRYYSGEDVLAKYGYDGSSKWTSTLILVGLMLIIRMVTLLILRYKRHGTR